MFRIRALKLENNITESEASQVLEIAQLISQIEIMNERGCEPSHSLRFTS
ncbi:40228_t:CDS:2 [Gigaspora margarita]|uniref:40228_t:CDS:1 n=1 Tax=Gigaspora margarita TaxID=4874 RepID=A0ABM8W5N9_GIGMA|nr:40228_t:CDS:2 [Gigaspora margarita]